MEPAPLQHVNLRFFLDPDVTPDFNQVTGLFQRWITEESLPGLLIDVANYAHVPAGPRLLLVGLEADYGLDDTGHRYGLRYNRKKMLDGSNEDRLRDALRSAARVCLRIERETAAANPLRFHRRELEILINDRALAPNSEEAWAAFSPQVSAMLERALGHRDFELSRDGDPRRRLAAMVRTGRPFDLEALASA